METLKETGDINWNLHDFGYVIVTDIFIYFIILSQFKVLSKSISMEIQWW